MSAIVALLTLAFGPSSQTTGSAVTAVFAFQKPSATTATPLSPTATTDLTPRIPCTLAASKLLTLPPCTGQSRIAATSMPGNLTSMPYISEPSTFGAVSSRFTGLPAIFQSFGSLSLISFGGSSLAAASAPLPKVIVRPEGSCVITLLAALHSAGGTLQSAAAARISISRAAAPPSRTYLFDSRIPRLPPVEKLPQTRLRATFSAGLGNSVLTFDQSHSSSSATSWARPVNEP